jgi:hypothetical protein
MRPLDGLNLWILTYRKYDDAVFRGMARMTTPHERLTRMRKSFAKNKSVLAEDYKYFTTPDVAP